MWKTRFEVHLIVKSQGTWTHSDILTKEVKGAIPVMPGTLLAVGELTDVCVATVVVDPVDRLILASSQPIDLASLEVFEATRLQLANEGWSN